MSITYGQQFDSDYLEAAHLDSEATLKISEVVPRKTRKAKDGKLIDKPILQFEGAKRGLVLNKTNAKVLALMYGNKMDLWVGKPVTLFATTCKAFGSDNTPCIRVRVVKEGQR
jgi:hypothetical protein